MGAYGCAGELYNMMHLSNTQALFFPLLRAGLWEKDVQFPPDVIIPFEEVYRLASEQSVVGLVTAGLEHVVGEKTFRHGVMSFLSDVLVQEQRNVAMNSFIATLVEDLREAGVSVMLVKGQGIAQCYERPMWRTSGDVDLLLDADNYIKAKSVLSMKASSVELEDSFKQHQAMRIGPWEVELHGTLRSLLGKKIDVLIDDVQRDTFENRRVRSWKNGPVDVLLPLPDNDLIFVFTHILQHFFRGGIGLRQICDWCRLLWTFRDTLDLPLLSYRLKSAGLLPEWHTFAALAVEWLGMPEEVMPLYSSARRWSRKAGWVMACILKTGNLGHNRDMSYFQKRPYVVRKFISFWRHTKDALGHFRIFPFASIQAWWQMFFHGIRMTTFREESTLRR